MVSWWVFVCRWQGLLRTLGCIHTCTHMTHMFKLYIILYSIIYIYILYINSYHMSSTLKTGKDRASSPTNLPFFTGSPWSQWLPQNFRLVAQSHEVSQWMLCSGPILQNRASKTYQIYRLVQPWMILDYWSFCYQGSLPYLPYLLTLTFKPNVKTREQPSPDGRCLFNSKTVLKMHRRSPQKNPARNIAKRNSPSRR